MTLNDFQIIQGFLLIKNLFAVKSCFYGREPGDYPIQNRVCKTGLDYGCAVRLHFMTNPLRLNLV